MTTVADPKRRVRVTAADIRGGVCGDVFRCAVAAALQRATGDDEARVVEKDWETRIEVWGQSICAPAEVREFVWEFDTGVERKPGGKPKLPRKLPENLRPFTFNLPPAGDPAWEEECYGCEHLFKPEELDDEGYCPECHETETP